MRQGPPGVPKVFGALTVSQASGAASRMMGTRGKREGSPCNVRKKNGGAALKARDLLRPATCYLASPGRGSFLLTIPGLRFGTPATFIPTAQTRIGDRFETYHPWNAQMDTNICN